MSLWSRDGRGHLTQVRNRSAHRLRTWCGVRLHFVFLSLACQILKINSCLIFATAKWVSSRTTKEPYSLALQVHFCRNFTGRERERERNATPNQEENFPSSFTMSPAPSAVLCAGEHSPQAALRRAGDGPPGQHPHLHHRGPGWEVSLFVWLGRVSTFSSFPSCCLCPWKIVMGSNL